MLRVVLLAASALACTGSLGGGPPRDGVGAPGTPDGGARDAPSGPDARRPPDAGRLPPDTAPRRDAATMPDAAGPDAALQPDGPATPERLGMATHFDGLGQPAGGCGVPQDILESPHFVALNVQDTPGDYAGTLPRPIPAGGPIGEFDNGRNCGRWVRVTIGEWCTGTNDGAAGQPFCRGGEWIADEHTGATLDLVVADSCQDGNAWCRDDRYHLDLATGSLGAFVKDGRPTVGLPARWNNRRVRWRWTAAPGYTGDVRIGFRGDAQRWWPAIVITNLENGVHGVEQLVDGIWQRAAMVGDNGQVFVLPGGAPPYRIRIRDASDRLVGGGRVYAFDFPASCGERCSAPFTEVAYTTSAP